MPGGARRNVHTGYLHPAGTESPVSSFLLDRDRDHVKFSDYSRMINKHQAMNVLIAFFSLWDQVPFLYEVTDVIDSHSLFCGLWRMLDVDYPPDANANPYGYFLMEPIIPPSLFIVERKELEERAFGFKRLCFRLLNCEESSARVCWLDEPTILVHFLVPLSHPCF